MSDMLDIGQPNARKLPSSAATNLSLRSISKDVAKVINTGHPVRLMHWIGGLPLIRHLLDAVAAKFLVDAELVP